MSPSSRTRRGSGAASPCGGTDGGLALARLIALIELGSIAAARVKRARGFRILEQATMNWMSAMYVAVLIVLAAEAMGAVFTQR